MPFNFKMGSRVSTNNNGGSTGKMVKTTKSTDNRGAVLDLQKELLARDELLTKRDKELNEMRQELAKKDDEIGRLEKRVHELNCVVQQTSSKHDLQSITEEKPELQRANSMKWKRQAVSGESSSNIKKRESNRELVKFSKDAR